MSERTGKRGGMWLLNRRGGLGDWQGWSWRSGLALARMGGGVSVLGLGVHDKRVFGGTWVARGAEMDVPTDRSYPRVGVHPLGWCRNGREGESGCASGALGWRGARMHEQE
jgi:hypothetical protein